MEYKDTHQFSKGQIVYIARKEKDDKPFIELGEITALEANTVFATLNNGKETLSFIQNGGFFLVEKDGKARMYASEDDMKKEERLKTLYREIKREIKNNAPYCYSEEQLRTILNILEDRQGCKSTQTKDETPEFDAWNNLYFDNLEAERQE